MEKMTTKELRHTRKLVRILRKAKDQLLDLANVAAGNYVFPKTTLKAYVEVSEALNRAELRIVARDSGVV